MDQKDWKSVLEVKASDSISSRPTDMAMGWVKPRVELGQVSAARRFRKW